jgi:hypothetical protein
MTTSTSLLGSGDELPKALANYFDALDDGRLDEASEAYAQDVLYAVPPAGPNRDRSPLGQQRQGGCA